MIFTPLMYLKAGALVVLLAIFLWGAVVIRGWHNDSLRLSDVEARSAEQVAEARRVVESMKAAQEAAYAASSQYQKELETLRRRPAVTGPVRLCVPARVPSSAPVAGGPGPAVPPGGVGESGDAADHSEGPDIAADLDALARRCDQVTAQGRAIQALY